MSIGLFRPRAFQKGGMQLALGWFAIGLCLFRISQTSPIEVLDTSKEAEGPKMHNQTIEIRQPTHPVEGLKSASFKNVTRECLLRNPNYIGVDPDKKPKCWDDTQWEAWCLHSDEVSVWEIWSCGPDRWCGNWERETGNILDSDSIAGRDTIPACFKWAEQVVERVSGNSSTSYRSKPVAAPPWAKRGLGRVSTEGQTSNTDDYTFSILYGRQSTLGYVAFKRFWGSKAWGNHHDMEAGWEIPQAFQAYYMTTVHFRKPHSEPLKVRTSITWIS